MGGFRKRHDERLWELYGKALQGLASQHRNVPDEHYTVEGDREYESARDIARNAMLLALCAYDRWAEHERTLTEFNQEVE
jgi:hypothetical protein